MTQARVQKRIESTFEVPAPVLTETPDLLSFSSPPFLHLFFHVPPLPPKISYQLLAVRTQTPLKLCRLWQMRQLLTTFVFLCHFYIHVLASHPPLLLFLKRNTTNLTLKCGDPSRKLIMLAAALCFTYLLQYMIPSVLEVYLQK